MSTKRRFAHAWRLVRGEVDEFGYDGDTHNGPRCVREGCWEAFCQFCEPDRFEEAEAEGCPGRERVPDLRGIPANWYAGQTLVLNVGRAGSTEEGNAR